MNDFHFSDTIDQRAFATVTVEDFAAGDLTAASGTLEVTDNDGIDSETAATGSITYGAPADTDTVIVNGTTFTKVAAAPGAGEFTSIAELEALIEALTGINSSQDGTTIAITSQATGAGGNAITLALGEENTGTMAISGATLTGGVDGHTITVGLNTLKFGTDITKGASEADTAEAIKTAVHALAAVNATRSSETVTITAATAGEAGNDITFSTNAPGTTASGSALTGGKDAFVLTLDNTALTEGTDFHAIDDNETTAADIVTAVDTVAGFKGEASGNVVTIYFATPGTGGNAKTLTTSDEVNLPISGETLSGGVAATYTPAFDVADAAQVEETLIVTSKSGTLPTLDVTPQRSVDGGDSWIDDATAFAQKTNTGNETLEEGLLGGLRRYKLVTGGTNPIFGVKIAAFCKN